MSVPIAFAVVVLIWATTPLAIQFSNHEQSFTAALAVRMWLGASIAWVLVRVCKIELPWDKASLKVYGAVAIGLAFAMLIVYYAAPDLPSGLISVIFGMSSLVVSLLSLVLLPAARWSLMQFVSVLLGVLGLALIFRNQLQVGSESWVALLLNVVSMLLYSLSTVLVKKQQTTLHPLAQTAGGLIVSAPVYVIAWAIYDSSFTVNMDLKSMAAITYLATFGSVIGFVLFFYLLGKMTADKVSLITLVTPVIAIVLGNLVQGEVLSYEAFAGVGLIMLGLACHRKATSSG